jgi:hypothetical protein
MGKQKRTTKAAGTTESKSMIPGEQETAKEDLLTRPGGNVQDLAGEWGQVIGFRWDRTLSMVFVFFKQNFLCMGQPTEIYPLTAPAVQGKISS